MRLRQNFRGWKHKLRSPLVMAIMCILAAKLWAVDPRQKISQYGHTAWRIQDGFFSGAPRKITQTEDGYLWIGTANGLFRFDGASFSPWSELSTTRVLASAPVTALHGARDGSLWIGAGFSLYRWKQQQLTQLSRQDATIDEIVQAPNGSIAYTRNLLRYNDNDGELCWVVGSETPCVGPHEGMSQQEPVALMLDPSGNFWIGGDGPNLLRWRSDSTSSYHFKNLPQGIVESGIEAILLDRQNNLWLGGESSRKGFILGTFKHGLYYPFHSPETDRISDSVSKLFLDRDGSIWVGTDQHGLYRISEKRIDHFDSADGLSSDEVADIYQDHEGTIWVATSRGVDSFRDLPVVSWTNREGLIYEYVRSVLSTADGALWIANDPALQSMRNGAIKTYGQKDGLPGADIGAMLDDPKRGLWLGIGLGLYLYNGKSSRQIIASGFPNLVIGMTLGSDGSAWILNGGVAGGELFNFKDDHLTKRATFPSNELILTTAADNKGGVWVAGDKLRYFQGPQASEISGWNTSFGYARNIVLDSDNDFVWFGATKSLVGRHAGRLQAMTTANGLPCERINTLIIDAHQSLWLYMQCALVRIDHDELLRWWSHPSTQVSMTIFDGLDGFRGGKEAMDPSAARAHDGKLWFANGTFLQMIDPDHRSRNELPPPVHVEKIIADGKAYSPLDPIQFPRSTRSVEISYSGLSFVLPQRVHFRYKLEGYDTEWQQAGTRRSAFYTNLRHGRYKFDVIASNNDGVWSDTPATVPFEIAPALYQTIWFRILIGLTALAALFGLDSLRMRHATERMKARLEDRLDERGRIARELHDTLIQSVDGLMIYLQAAIEEPDPIRARSMLEKALDRADEVMGEGRERVQTLRAEAVKVEDLALALTDYAENRAREKAIRFSLTMQGLKRRLDPLARDEAFRIGREALANAFQHAGASMIEVVLEYGRSDFRLTVKDNGSGIPENLLKQGRPGHWGLAGIRERAKNIKGSLNIRSDSFLGTEISLQIPGPVAYPSRFSSIPYLPFIKKVKIGRG
jgi:signal transduction histidine kinase/ligand-binding sensor domain-containing protein